LRCANKNLIYIGNKLSLSASFQGNFRRSILRKIESGLAVDREKVQRFS